MRSGFLSTDLLRAVILSAALAAAIFLTANYTNIPHVAEAFSFQEQVPPKGSSISMSDITGKIFATTWAQPQVMINGTIVATGEGASPNNVRLQEQNTDGTVTFQQLYNDKSAGRSYTVNVNLYLPSKTNFTSITIAAIENGVAHLDSLNASHLYVSTSTGNITMALNPSQSGDYGMSTSNGGNINLKIPANSSFQLKATTGYGYMGQIAVNGFQQCTVGYFPNHQNAPGNTGATIACGNKSANITVWTGFVGGVLQTGDITIVST